MRLSGKQRIILAIAPPLTALVVRVIGLTLRYREIAEPGAHIQRIDSPPGIYCFWHRCLIPAAWYFRGWKIGILISQSFDGELIARTVERLGYTPVRGSSTRGGVSALKSAPEIFAQGHNIAVTADGPRGPLYQSKPGAIKLAQLTQTFEVGAFYVHPERAWHLPSWDKFMVPKPFSRVTVSFAKLTPVEADLDAAALESTRQQLTAAIERARLAAERGGW